MKRIKTKVLLPLVLLSFICLFLFFLYFAGTLLVLDEIPEKSDAIIVLSPGTERLVEGARLYKSGYAKKLMLSRANTGEFTVESIVRLGVPEEKLILEKNAISTYTNAVYTKKKLEEFKFKSAIIVTSDYHMRRTKFVFDKVYRDSGIKLFFSSARSDYRLTDWWNDEESKRIVAKEYIKLIGYYILY